MARKVMVTIIVVALVALLGVGGFLVVSSLRHGGDDTGTDAPATYDQTEGGAVTSTTGTGTPAVSVPQADETVSEIVPVESDQEGRWGEGKALDGDIKFEDIPGPSQVEGGYSSDEVKEAIVSYIQTNYPTEVIASIELIGNGSDVSQEMMEESSYASYLVTLTNQMDIGLFVRCSDSTAPKVTEARFLVVNETLLYDVANKNYIPMS